MVEVIWRNEALDDLDQVIAYIEQFDPIAAQTFEQRLFMLGESLSSFPHRGRPIGGDTRELTAVPPYILRYDVTEAGVHILSIRHGRRRPPA